MYFQCVEVFKEDTELRIQLKLWHRNEDENDLRIAFQHVEEEIAPIELAFRVENNSKETISEDITKEHEEFDAKQIIFELKIVRAFPTHL